MGYSWAIQIGLSVTNGFSISIIKIMDIEKPKQMVICDGESIQE
jgi:hypothetical protein